jgi:hypothetical protein
MFFRTHNRTRSFSANAQFLSRFSIALLLRREVIHCLESVHVTVCRFDTRTFSQVFNILLLTYVLSLSVNSVSSVRVWERERDKELYSLTLPDGPSNCHMIIAATYKCLTSCGSTLLSVATVRALIYAQRDVNPGSLTKHQGHHEKFLLQLCSFFSVYLHDQKTHYRIFAHRILYVLMYNFKLRLFNVCDYGLSTLIGHIAVFIFVLCLEASDNYIARLLTLRPTLWFSCSRRFSSCSTDISQQITQVVLFLFLFLFFLF